MRIRLEGVGRRSSSVGADTHRLAEALDSKPPAAVGPCIERELGNYRPRAALLRICKTSLITNTRMIEYG
jgi:hypothetical protein